jgi:hypothetical protein
MRVIDARTGSEVAVGQTVEYGDGESVTLIDLAPGILRAAALVKNVFRDHSGPHAPLRESIGWTRLHVRWTHPHFFGQHIAFIPS